MLRKIVRILVLVMMCLAGCLAVGMLFLDHLVPGGPRNDVLVPSMLWFGVFILLFVVFLYVPPGPISTRAWRFRLSLLLFLLPMGIAYGLLGGEVFRVYVRAVDPSDLEASDKRLPLSRLGHREVRKKSLGPAVPKTLKPERPETPQLEPKPLPVPGPKHLEACRELRNLGAMIRDTRAGTWVDFDDSPVTNVGLAHLKDLTNLKGLSLRNTKVTDPGLEHLKALTELEWLYLNETQITDVGLEHLKVLTNLRHLGLGGTQVTDEGVKKLQLALPHCCFEDVVPSDLPPPTPPAPLRSAWPKSVDEVAITEIKKLGGKVEFDKTSLEKPAVSVDFRGSQVTDAGLMHLKGLENLHSLNLETSRVTDAGLVHLHGLPRLETLDLSTLTVTDAGLGELLKTLPRLQALDLTFTGVTDAGLAHLKELSQLRSLSLGGVLADWSGPGKGLALLKPSPISDAGLEHLRGLKTLRELILYGTGATEEGVKRLQEALPKCDIQRQPLPR